MTTGGSNPGSLEYETAALTTRPRRFTCSSSYFIAKRACTLPATARLTLTVGGVARWSPVPEGRGRGSAADVTRDSGGAHQRVAIKAAEAARRAPAVAIVTLLPLVRGHGNSQGIARQSCHIIASTVI